MNSQTCYECGCIGHLLVSGQRNFQMEGEAAHNLHRLADETQQLSGDAMARVRSQASPCNICGGQVALG